MPREAGLFEAANGSIVEAYFLLRNSGKNIPPAWIDKEKAVGSNLQNSINPKEMSSKKKFTLSG